MKAFNNKALLYFLLIIVLASCSNLTPIPETTSEVRENTSAAPLDRIDVTTTATLTIAYTPSPTFTQFITTCLPESVFFPLPEELENYIGWQYNYHKAIPGYWGGTLIIRDDDEYGLGIFRRNDKSFALVFKKLLCRDEGGHVAWEILDVLRTRPPRDNERADIAYCKKNGERTTDYPFVFMDQSNNGTVYAAWSIGEDFKIAESSVDGLSCFIDGEP